MSAGGDMRGAAKGRQRPRTTLLVDPRFSGGTSTAVASEILVLADTFDLTIAAYTSAMFRGDDVHPAIQDACFATGTEIIWDPEVVSGENVIVHNPSFLKFDDALSCRIFCDRLIVVCHENFERPTGAPGFDVDKCLTMLRDSTLARHRILAPISGWNRVGVENWAKRNNAGWEIATEDWTNICEFELVPPTEHPRDRRGRHSRPGFEKFPDLETLQTIFPEGCDAVRILGADSILEDAPGHWDLIPFKGEPVEAFLRTIDFVVYYTNASWRESFGRAIAEAIAAGKLVITDEMTGRTFGDGVITARPEDVNGIIAAYLDDPQSYVQRVSDAQSTLRRYSAKAFLERVDRILKPGVIGKNEQQSVLEKLNAFV